MSQGTAAVARLAVLSLQRNVFPSLYAASPSLLALCQFNNAHFRRVASNAASSTITTQQLKWLSATPKSLAADHGEQRLPNGLDHPIGRGFLFLTGYYAKTSRLMRGSAQLLEMMNEQIDNPDMYRYFGLQRSKFFDVFVLLGLHCWIVNLRTQIVPGMERDAEKFRNIFHQTFIRHVGQRANVAGIELKIKEQVKELESLYLGSCQVYDKALMGQDRPLSDLMLHHIYSGAEDKRQCAERLAKYCLRELNCLKLTPFEDVMRGNVKFTIPPPLAPSSRHSEAVP